jgi:Terminase large subunit, T4likevirus-type, N-terminal
VTRTARRALPPVGLLEAVDDRKLLGAGFKPWERQRALLEGVEGGPRVQVWALGRRSGKTTLAALVAVWDCLFRPELQERVRAGERRYAVAVATNLRQARLFVRAAASIVEASPLLRTQLEAQIEDELLFRTGTALSAFPCTSRGGRGWPISTLALDEFAHHVPDETEGPQSASRLLASLAPATSQFGDLARILVVSTPYGSDGPFAELFQRAMGGELEDAAAHRATTLEMNPTISEGFLAQEERRDPDVFRGEYLAEFIGGGGAFLDPEDLAAAVADRAELLPEHADGWVAGLDPAFSSDPFGLALVGRDRNDRRRLLLGVARAWQPRRRGSFEESRAFETTVLAEVAEVCRRYRARVVTDQYAAPSIVDFLRRRGLSVRTVPMTVSSKTDAFVELRARLASGGLELYEVPQLLTELRRLRSKVSAGSSRVVNPRVGGSHGDLAQALAIAVYEHGRHGLAPAEEPFVGGESGLARALLSPKIRYYEMP